MTVRCKVNGCPYSDGKGFCAREPVIIDENGMCGVLWRRGQQKRVVPPFYPKHPITIV